MHLYFARINSLIIFHCIDIYHVYPCVYWWTFFSLFICDELCCCKHLCTGFFVGTFVFLLNIIPRSGIAGSSGSSVFKHLRSNQALFQVAAPFSIPSGGVCRFWFLRILTITCSYLSFFLAILGDAVLECMSLMTNDFEYILICVLFVHLLWRNVCSDPLPIFKLDYLCVIALLEFVYSRSKFLIRYVVGKYFLPFHDLSFHLTLLLFISVNCPSSLITQWNSLQRKGKIKAWLFSFVYKFSK